MRVTIFGSGYVGLVTGACLADAGNDVLCVDVDAAKIAALKQGVVPIHEPGLDALIRSNIEAERLKFTTSAKEGVDFGLFQLIAVGTPPDEDGSADLKYVLSVARSIGEHMNEYKVIITKSTVPVGTSDKVRTAVAETLKKRDSDVEYDVVSNPEFLKEGAAIEDFMRPDRVVVGTDNPRVTELLRALYDPFTRSREKLVIMDLRSAELTKYAANAMLATKISFMNELANLADRFGADIEKVRVGIGSDPRIGYHFIYPGVGYGGSCFPKDVQALARSARGVGYEAKLLDSVETVNRAQKQVLFSKISKHFGGNLKGRTIALWGLAFKPGTDDMREAPSRVLLEQLWNAGAKVRAFDPAAMKETRRIFGDRPDLTLCNRARETLEGADALAIVTEWKEFRSPDFDNLKKQLKAPVIFDGRNLYDPAMMKKLGVTYYAIGRGEGRG
ncbi:MAG TPA: UDP-glucose/GDP-mannose dehydrogenase family protein [Steroidobacteraceae bacterium]|nr:UDP-glucose/GDP-mannose dehydrogenase family protein [Steroidobacteraceae bacterium]